MGAEGPKARGYRVTGTGAGTGPGTGTGTGAGTGPTGTGSGTGAGTGAGTGQVPVPVPVPVPVAGTSMDFTCCTKSCCSKRRGSSRGVGMTVDARRVDHQQFYPPGGFVLQ